MVEYKRKVLSNGLRVISHYDDSTQIAAVNVLYDVGSRDEDPNRTGFAHLFEHLMFSGSKHVKDYDIPVQQAGGENNAFTNCDMTNFYEVIPVQNIETALWLESDRMMSLNITEKSLSIQKDVVVEEFNETCINQPYGDLWHKISGLAYKSHPYRWPTIGIKVDHIRKATLSDVKNFYHKHYHPENAILVIAGNIPSDKAFQMAERWFGDVPAGNKIIRNLPSEEKQTAYRYQEIKSNVPAISINLSYHIPNRLSPDFYAYDLLTDVMSNGVSSRLFHNLVKDQCLFSDVDAFITGTIDPGLLVVTGKLMADVDFKVARQALQEEIEKLKREIISENELVMLKNKAESNLKFSEINILHKAMSLAFFEMIGDIDIINKEADYYNQVTREDILRIAQETFRKENCSEIIYFPIEKE